VSEIDILRRLATLAGGGKGVVRGIGDDCAILRIPQGAELLIHTDMLIEDVHFRRRTHSAKAIGAKTLARGLSDVAAMGGTPRWALLSLAVPGWAEGRFLKAFYDGLLALGKQHGVALVGGDLAKSDRLSADIVILGTAPIGQALRRDTAKPGDGIYVSGALGHAAASRWREAPEPRLALGRWLRGRATACMDLSDGLSIDLHRLCWESKVSAGLDREPPRALQATPDQALHGGEDYELLFTTTKKMPKRYRGLAITRVGTIMAGSRGRVTLLGKELKAGGWDHFRKAR
jgi:thiamine-monophosphate kinase